MKPQVLPESFLRRMSKADRAPMGKAGMTKPEVQAKVDRVSERVVHGQIAGWLATQNIFAIHSRMDRKTTNQSGVPDFLFVLAEPEMDSLDFPKFKADGHQSFKVRPIAIEVKVNGNKMSDDQIRVRELMLSNGWEYYTVSALSQVVKLVKGES